MTYRIRLSRQARNALASLPVGVASAVVEFSYGPLAENPRQVGKPLTNELAGAYSARRGSYRILYRIDEAQVAVEVIKIGYRGNVYSGLLAQRFDLTRSAVVSNVRRSLSIAAKTPASAPS